MSEPTTRAERGEDEEPAPVDEPLVEAEPVEVPEIAPATAPGSESTAQREPDEALSYVERAQEALVKVAGAPGLGNLSTELLDRLTILVLVRGDRCTAADIHDVDMVALARDPSLADEPGAAREVLPFDVLDPREQRGLEDLALIVQKAGRFMGRDGS